MIGVTDDAKDVLYDVLEQAGQEAGVDEDVAIRLAPVDAPENAEAGGIGLGLMLDQPHEGDQVVEHRGRKVLVVDEPTSDMLRGITLDAVDTPDGRRLTISQQEPEPPTS